jgi:hypothetical protein
MPAPISALRFQTIVVATIAKWGVLISDALHFFGDLCESFGQLVLLLAQTNRYR